EDDKIKDYYQKNKSRYQRPEQVRVEYIELAARDLEAAVKVNEEDLKQFIDSQQQKSSQSEERRARHILVQIDDGAAQDKADAAKKKVDDLYKQIKKGADFAQLAKKESDDPGSKANGGDLGFFGRGVMDAAFEKAAFALKPGQLSEPVRSRFGYHIIKLEEIRGEKKVSTEDKRAELTAAYRKQAAEKRFAELYESLANAAYEHPDTLMNAAQVAGVPMRVSDFFARTGGPGIAGNTKVAAAAFSNDVYKDNVNSELIEAGLNHVVVLRVKDKMPAMDRPIDEVRAQIVNDLKDAAARDQVRELGQAMVTALLAGKDFTSQVKEHKLTIEKAQLARNDSKVNATLLRTIFKMPKPIAGKAHFEAVALDNGDYAVVAMRGVAEGVLAQAEQAQKEAAKNDMQRMWSTAESAMLKKSLKDKYKIERFPERL
ncbi:MAG: peptidylprolyl isomerase, partial [Pseudomonadota bacterium]